MHNLVMVDVGKCVVPASDVRRKRQAYLDRPGNSVDPYNGYEVLFSLRSRLPRS